MHPFSGTYNIFFLVLGITKKEKKKVAPRVFLICCIFLGFARNLKVRALWEWLSWQSCGLFGWK